MLVSMFVDFQWSIKFLLRMDVLEKQEGVVLAGPSQFGVHQMNTSGSSCHTAVADMIKRAWLDSL